MKDRIIEVLKSNNSSPFLFLGSGFSRRYIGLENWSELLTRFTEDIKPFEYYKSSANQDMPLVASMIAKDFHEAFWNYPKYVSKRNNFKEQLISNTSALRISISEYLKQKVSNQKINEKTNVYVEEINLLRRLNVDGIITTNWDTFIDDLFPKYKIFTGQKELLFSNPQSIGEIYKIHGCITRPESLVLTYEAINTIQRKIPARVLRFCKEQLEEQNFDAKEILDKTIPNSSGFVPIHKYLMSLPTETRDIIKNKLKERLNINISCFQTKNYHQAYLTHAFQLGVSDIIKFYPEKACHYIPFAEIEESDLVIIRQFLVDKFDHYMVKDNRYRTDYRKLACLYDFKFYYKK
jgi:hypothetical protein